MGAPGPDRRLTVVIEDPRSDGARAQLGAYLEEIASRYHGRPLSSAEQELALAGIPGDDLVEPHGVLLIARLHTQDVGCVGLRFLDGAIGEVTSLFVVEDVRRQGIGGLLLDKVEAIARDRGLSILRLDTRHDLVEARRLYVRHGFREVPAFNHEPYAERWFAKAL